jgi:glutamyl-tRNA synthetase
VIDTAQAVAWFDLDAIGRAPARFDFAKLDSINGHYIRAAPDGRLAVLVAPLVERTLGHALDGAARDRLCRAMPGLKPRAKTLRELADRARFYVTTRPIAIDDKAKALLDEAALSRLASLAVVLIDAPWTAPELEALVRQESEAQGVGLGAVAQPLRAALVGATASPGIFEVMEVLGRDETLGRLADVAPKP